MELNWKMGQQMLVANENGYEFRVSWGPEREWQGQRLDPDYFRGNHQACRGLCGASSIESAIAWCERTREPSPKETVQQSFDARDWAKEFLRCCECAPGLGPVAPDEETMVGWFANALMRGYDEHRWKAERDVKPPSPPAPEPTGGPYPQETPKLACLISPVRAKEILARLAACLEKLEKLEARP